MPKMSVRISCQINRGETSLRERTVEVSEEQLVQFIPPSPAGGGEAGHIGGKRKPWSAQS